MESAIVQWKLPIAELQGPNQHYSEGFIALFAFLSIFTVSASDVLLLLLAVGCIYLPYLLLLNQTMAVQVVLLFWGGIAVAATMLWSLLPRRDKFDAPGPLLDRLTQSKLFREIDQVADALNEQVPGEVYLICSRTPLSQTAAACSALEADGSWALVSRCFLF
jgi:hypothetical protein